MFSVVLPAYNAEKTIIQTLNSVSAQSFKKFELIIINDGSLDDTKKLVTGFLEQNKNIQAKLISRENRGFLVSLREGIEDSTQSFIARIDADDLWEKNHLETLKSEFKKDDNLVLVGTNAKLIDKDGKIIGKTNQPTNVIRALMNDNPFFHSSVAFKKDAYSQTTGYIKERNKSNDLIADYDLWIQLSRLGRCKISKKRTIRYRYLETSISRILSLEDNYTGRLKMIKKAFKVHKKYPIYFMFNFLKLKARLAKQKLFH